MNSLTPWRTNRREPSVRSMLDLFDMPMRSFFDDPFFNRKSLNADISEEQDKYVVKAEVPGLSEDNIDINFENGKLNIVAQYKEEDKSSMRSGSWSWSYYIPNVSSDAISAEMKNGILSVSLPKSESSKAQKIKIN